MNYCQPNQPITDVWIGGAFNQCFIDTFASIFIALLMGGCAIAECVIYRRHGTRLDRNLLGVLYFKSTHKWDDYLFEL
jgi:hypothetical protein